MSPLRAWQLAAVLFGVAAAAMLAFSLAQSSRIVVPGVQGFLGYDAVPSRFGSVSAHRITRFEPESPLSAAGVSTGDLIVDPPRGALLAGETVKLRIAHQRIVRVLEVKAVHIDRLATPVQNVLDFCLATLLLTLGVLLISRRSRDLGAVVLAAEFFMAAAGLQPEAVGPGRLAAAYQIWQVVCLLLALPTISYFMVVFEGGYQSRARKWILSAISALGSSAAVWVVLAGPYFIGRSWIGTHFLLVEARPAMLFVGLALCVVAFTDTWRHSEAERRERLRWLCAGLGVALAGLFFFVFVAYSGVVDLTAPAVLRASVTTDSVVGVGMIILTYAILRHRVIDLGFAINRALVFAVFTGFLLVCFGIVEWLLEHFLRFDKRENSVLWDGVIALTIYLAFHSARHRVGRLVERLFFRSWHLQEATLQRFLDMAPQFSQPDALTVALLAAVDAYAGCTGSGIYVGDGLGHFKLQYATLGTLPQELDSDAGVIVELKAFRQPLHLHNDSSLPVAVLALPMLRRAELVGVLALGPKKERQLYRLDEIDNLARAARQVGFDLYALRLEHSEQRRRELEHQNEGLRQGLRALGQAKP